MIIKPNGIYRVNGTPIKIVTIFFTKIEKNHKTHKEPEKNTEN